MKRLILRAPTVIVVELIAGHSRGQGTFQNLDFEQASIPIGTQPADTVPPSSGMPGWNLSAGLVYDGYSLGGVGISINDTNTYAGFVVPQGKYCAYLFGGGPVPNQPATISQTGLVPAGTESLRIDAAWFNVPFVVTLGGQTINMVPLTNFPTYTVYGGDISSFAGKVADLSFTAPAPPGPAPSRLLLDDIQFSPSAVPEPGTWALMLCGAAFFGAARWKNSNSKV